MLCKTVKCWIFVDYYYFKNFRENCAIVGVDVNVNIVVFSSSFSTSIFTILLSHREQKMRHISFCTFDMSIISLFCFAWKIKTKQRNWNPIENENQINSTLVTFLGTFNSFKWSTLNLIYFIFFFLSLITNRLENCIANGNSSRCNSIVDKSSKKTNQLAHPANTISTDI